MKMIVVLKKSWTNKFGRKYPVGQKIPCDKELGTYLIDKGYADDFEGKVLSKTKVKTKFFKNKD
jgi:hypothetical protein